MWAKKSNKPVEITQALGREFLKATGKLLPEAADATTYDGSDPVQTDEGFEYIFNTPPREKHRCVRPLLRPFIVAAFMHGDTTLKQFQDAAKEAYRKALASLDSTFDSACADLARAYYAPTQRATRMLPSALHVRGAAFDLHPFVQAALLRAKAKPANGMASHRSRSGPHSSSKPPVGPLGSVPRQHCHVEGRDLTKWAARYAKTFDFEQLFQRNGLVKGERGQGGRYIDCFHDGHSGGQAETYLVNGDESKGFILHCSGASGGCPTSAIDWFGSRTISKRDASRSLILKTPPSAVVRCRRPRSTCRRLKWLSPLSIRTTTRQSMIASA